MSGVHGKLKGKKWSAWTEELDPGSPPGPSGAPSSRVSSPLVQDVMKLPKEDMTTYGQCPIFDRFVLVTCSKCSRRVKMEAFESHVTLRHGSKSERSAYHKVMAAKASAALKACQVKLGPMARMMDIDEKKGFSDPPDIIISGSSSSTSPLPISYPSTPPQFRVSSPSPLPSPTPPLSGPSIQPADSASAPDTRSPSPQLIHSEIPGEVESMDVDTEQDVPSDLERAATSTVKEAPALKLDPGGMDFVGEEADSTTHNVISIPDSDDIHNLEIAIISEGQVLDSINTKYNVSILKTDSSVDSTTSMPKTAPRPGQLIQSTLHPQLPLQPAVTVNQPEPPRPNPVQNLNNPVATPPRAPALPPRSSFQPVGVHGQEKMEVDQTSTPTHYITVSPLSKGISPKKPPVIIKAAMEKKPSGREREYDPNKHCGVWDADAKRNCTRSLTCKSHSVYLKRKVMNRSGQFDELLAAHKAEKEAAAARLTDSADGESILARRLQQAPATTTNKIWDQNEVAKQSSVLKPSVTKRNFFNSLLTKDNYCDENLHYTIDHPKPLAVCTYGGKRIGGLFIADRSRFLTRKVMKIAISSAAGGVQRIQTSGPVVGLRPDGIKRVAGLMTAPVTSRQQSMPYIVNLQGGGGGAGAPRVAALNTQHFIVQDAFKTDIQDFKGGIKFELGRNIHVLPSTDTGGGVG